MSAKKTPPTDLQEKINRGFSYGADPDFFNGGQHLFHLFSIVS